LELDSSTIASNQLGGFAATIAGLNVGSSNTTPTNEIDLANIASTNITSVTLSGSTITVTTTASGSFNLTLGSAPGAGTFVNWISDGVSGTDLFLSTAPQFHAQGSVDSWLDPTSWGGTVPSTQPAAGTAFSFSNFNSGANYIYMPSTLQQATGTGTSTWTINDNVGGVSQYTSELS
jgi:hypothetical protein